MKRCLKRLGFTFRRARRVPEKAACPKKQGRVQRALSRLHRLEDAGKCQVLYGDESGFCLSPVCRTCGSRRARRSGCLPKPIRAA